MTFTDTLVESTSPWNDPNGFWATYNAALGSMFEQVFGLVADQGDVEQTYVGVLRLALTTSTPITSLPVQNLTISIPVDTEITLISGLNIQVFVTSTTAHSGATSIPVFSQTPNFAYGIGTPVQLAYIPGWSVLLDPLNCPDLFLTFLAQFNGTDVPVGLDSDTARLKIVAENAEQRGTLASIGAAVRRNLTGTQSVAIQERIDTLGNANGYWFVVVVRPGDLGVPSQTINDVTVPTSGNVQALIDSVNAVKPGGVMWSLVVTDGWTISQMEASQASISALEGNFVTITGLEQDLPGT